MKKLMTIIAGLVALSGTACSDNDRAITVVRLPEQAQEFIAGHFAGEKIAYVKQEMDFFVVKYGVMFVRGALVEFDRRGRWTEMECRYDVLDAGLVPEQIRMQVADNWPGNQFRKISRDRKEYEVKLTSGLELTFDRFFNLMDIDD